MQSLDDVFNGADDQLAEPTAEVASNAEDQKDQSNAETEAKSDADTGPKGEDSQEQKEEIKRETPARETEKEDWTFAAYRDEKRKRQELEKRLEELEKPKEEVKAPDVLNDPDGFQQYQSQQLDQKVNNVKAEMSQFYAEKEFGKEKVQTAFNKFSEMVKDNPALYQQALSAVSPYHEIVELVDKAEKFEQMQDIESYEAKLRAEIEQKIRAEFQAQESQKSAKKSVTPSLNSLTQAEGNSTEVSQSLGDIFGR